MEFERTINKYFPIKVTKNSLKKIDKSKNNQINPKDFINIK